MDNLLFDKMFTNNRTGAVLNLIKVKLIPGPTDPQISSPLYRGFDGRPIDLTENIFLFLSQDQTRTSNQNHSPAVPILCSPPPPMFRDKCLYNMSFNHYFDDI